MFNPLDQGNDRRSEGARLCGRRSDLDHEVAGRNSVAQRLLGAR